jgi:Ribulose-5-phosphate 4-epimerase and related epimerases and aldolases
MEQINDVIKKYAKLAAAYQPSGGMRIFVRHQGRLYGTRMGADFDNLKESDIRDVTDLYFPGKPVLQQKNDINALLYFKTPYLGWYLDRGIDINASLDDMAQIVGPTVTTVPLRDKEIGDALKKAAVVMVRNRSAIASGRSLYEAYTAMTVIEKSAEVGLKASVLGGAEKLSRFDARLMRTVYLTKYSKAEKEAKDESEG